MPSRRLDLLLTTLGSAGDVHPFIAVGRALAARGHRVRLLTNPYFERTVFEAGLGFLPLGTADEYRRVLQSPLLLHETLGPRFVIEELIVPNVPRILEAARAACARARPDALVAHHIAVPIPWLGETTGIPVATLALAPLFWLSGREPLSFAALRKIEPPVWLSRLHLAFGRSVLRRVFDRPLNRQRAALGLPPRRDFFFPGPHRGALEIALWSPLLRGALADDPPRSVIAGFARFDGTAPLDAALEAFLAQGPPPVVVTLGSTAVHGAGPLYGEAAAACRAAGRRAVLLGADPALAAPDVFVARYAPYDRLLPRGAATIHHGGIGTTAAALTAGRPQIVVPFANDEFDNARRVARLGTGTAVPRARARRDVLAARLRATLGDEGLAARTQALGERLLGEDGAAVAAAAIEELAGGGP